MRPANWVCSVALLSALCWLCFCGQLVAQNRTEPIKISVDSIVATYAPQRVSSQHAAEIKEPPVKMDPRLTSKGLAPRLRMMFDYTDYRLMKSQREAAPCGGAVAFNLPGGHILQVAPLQWEGENAVAIELALFEGTRLIMRLPFRMTTGGALMLVDEHYPNRYYITAIALDNADLGSGHSPAPGSTAPDNSVPAVPAWIPSQ